MNPSEAIEIVNSRYMKDIYYGDMKQRMESFQDALHDVIRLCYDAEEVRHPITKQTERIIQLENERASA
jgi:hypothetical protein